MQEQHEKAAGANSGNGFRVSSGCAGVGDLGLASGDGDTIRVRQAGKTLTVRLACIDAPESAQTPYSQRAREYP